MSKMIEVGGYTSLVWHPALGDRYRPFSIFHLIRQRERESSFFSRFPRALFFASNGTCPCSHSRDTVKRTLSVG